MALAPLYPVADHPLLSARYKALGTQPEKDAHAVLAELLLGLHPPALVDDQAETLTYAVVKQINFLLQQGVEPSILETSNQSTPGIATSYRDRYVDPGALAIADQVLKRARVGFTVPGPGV